MIPRHTTSKETLPMDKIAKTQSENKTLDWCLTSLGFTQLDPGQPAERSTNETLDIKKITSLKWTAGRILLLYFDSESFLLNTVFVSLFFNCP